LQRLLTRPEFQSVLAGKIVAKTPHFALHTQTLALPGLRMGAVVPKRWARRAVTRNTIKRQVFNVAASQQSLLTQQAYVVRLRGSFDRAVFVSACSDALKQAVRQELLSLFEIAIRRGQPPLPA
jgi:ribonuclease P protein component